MAEFELKSGRVLQINASELTVGEWRKFATKDGTVADENKVITKCTGLTPEEIDAVGLQEFRKLCIAIVRAANSPLSDPN